MARACVDSVSGVSVSGVSADAGIDTAVLTIALGPRSRSDQNGPCPDLELRSGDTVRHARAMYGSRAGKQTIDPKVIHRLGTPPGGGLKKAQREAFRVPQLRVVPHRSTRQSLAGKPRKQGPTLVTRNETAGGKPARSIQTLGSGGTRLGR